MDKDELVIYWNTDAEKIFGSEAQMAIGRNLH
ncbi:PAS domain-containing protein [Methylomonas sp.]